MAQLSQLLSRLPEGKSIHMSTMGHVLWVCWHDKLPPAVGQTMLTYGGMLVGEESEQAVWFFFTDDVFLALARLVIWGNFNDLPVSIELFPGRLELSRKGEASLSLEGALRVQEMMVLDKLEVWIHPKSRDGRNALPGITFKRRPGRQGMASVDWAEPEVDVRMPYSSSQAWYAILHPLGSPLDKAYQEGWYAMFKRIDALLQDLKMKFIVNENFVMIAVDNLLVLRNFLREYLRTFGKEEGGEPGWPCVCVVADRQNFNFNIDLPNKINLQWDRLTPDFPYVSYRNAYLLGEGFTVRDLRFTEQTSMDAWCNVLLNEASISTRTIPLMMAGLLTGSAQDEMACFYCGIASHAARDCPTRNYFPSSPDVWDELANLDLDRINKGFQEIEKNLEEKGLEAYEELLEGDAEGGLLLRAVLDLTSFGQLRNVPRYWLYHMRESAEQEEKPRRDDSPAWEFLEQLARAAPEELGDLERKLVKAIGQHQRDAKLRTLHGFLCVQKNDFEHAMAHFREATGLTPSPALQAWNEYLQARLEEALGHYPTAIEHYSQIFRAMPEWRDVRYRGIVCRVKMGFGEQALDQIVRLVREDPSYFNRVLIDPGLERGRLLILGSLHDIWDEAGKKAEDEYIRINALRNRLNDWFPDDHPVQMQLGQKVRQLENISNIKNYIAFLRVVEQRPILEKELDEAVRNEVEELRNRYKFYLDVLQDIRDEASWFPFPQALRDFSNEFNEAAGIINWAFSCNFNEAEAFRQAQTSTSKLNRLLRKLKRRLKSLRFVRDATLFAMTMGRTFFFVEAVGLLTIFILVPLIVFFGENLHLGWLKRLLGENQMSIVKVLSIIVTIISLGIGALRTTLVFESKREKLLEQAREQREKAQQTRLDRVRKQRQIEAEAARQAKKAEEEHEIRRQLKERM